MHDIPNRIADILLAVEATLRQHGRWDPVAPPDQHLGSAQPFCVDTLRFEQWLQWIFLPRMKKILENSRPLPSRSGIYHYAEHTLRRNDPPTPNLLKLIRQFDELIAIQATARPN